MKILIATDNRFWRRALGSQQRIYSLLKFLHDKGYKLEVMFIGAPTSEDHQLLQAISFARIRPTLPVQTASDAVHSESPKALVRMAKACLREVLQFLQRLPQETAYFIRHRKIGMSFRFDLALREPKLRDFFRPLAIERLKISLDQWQPDVLLIEYVRLSYLVKALPVATRKNLQVILDAHDVIFERRARFHAMGLEHDIDMTAAEEAASLKLYDAVIAIQSRDAAAFRALATNQKIIVAGHAQDIVRHSRSFDRSLRFLFVGSDMKPNQEAVLRLVSRIWPRIRSKLGNTVRLSIVGKAGAVLNGQNLPEGVEVTGFVDSLEEVYRTHDLFLNPVTFGGGLKIKNVEALAHGLVLITTPVGAEGMESGAGTAFIVARDELACIEAAIRLATDSEICRQLSEAALDFAQNYLGPQASYHPLEEYLASIKPQSNNESASC